MKIVVPVPRCSDNKYMPTLLGSQAINKHSYLVFAIAMSGNELPAFMYYVYLSPLSVSKSIYYIGWQVMKFILKYMKYVEV